MSDRVVHISTLCDDCFSILRSQRDCLGSSNQDSNVNYSSITLLKNESFDDDVLDLNAKLQREHDAREQLAHDITAQMNALALQVKVNNSHTIVNALDTAKGKAELDH